MRIKKLLLIDAVTWASEYPKKHALKSVPTWFKNGLEDMEHCELNVLHIEKNLDKAFQSDLHGVIISGSPRDAWDNTPTNESLLIFLRSCLLHRIPVLGVCYGHQMLARFLNGNVQRHPEGLQLLNAEIELTTAGRACPLFKKMKSKFNAISGHADYVVETPPHCTRLAGSELTEVQAFQFQNLFYGVQFHPEFTAEIIRFLWTPRIDSWKDKVSFDLAERLEKFKDPGPTRLILQNFVNHCVP